MEGQDSKVKPRLVQQWEKKATALLAPLPCLCCSYSLQLALFLIADPSCSALHFSKEEIYIPKDLFLA